MCGRVFVKSGPQELMQAFAIARRGEGDGLEMFRPTFNGAPGRPYPLIVAEPDWPGGMWISASWGFVPAWNRDPRPKVRPINTTCETVATNGMFRAAYQRSRALMPVSGFFEWQAIKGERRRRPYAIAMKDGRPYCVAAISDAWRHPETGELIRTFAVITCPSNDLVGRIHHRMPVIVAPEDYMRWISTAETDPRDLLKPYPSELMEMWPVDRRVNSPINDDPANLDPCRDAEPGLDP